MPKRLGAQTTVMSAKAATGIGTNINVAPYRHIGIAIIGASSPDLTVKCVGSYLMSGDANLDFSASASATNPWDFVGMYDLQTGNFIAGDTGIVFSGTADVTQYMVNTDCLRTLNFKVTARVAGSVTVIAFPMDNQ